MAKTEAPNANLNQLNDKAQVGNSTFLNGNAKVVTTTIGSIGNDGPTISSPVEDNLEMVGNAATVSGSETPTTSAMTTTVGLIATRSGTSAIAHNFTRTTMSSGGGSTMGSESIVTSYDV